MESGNGAPSYQDGTVSVPAMGWRGAGGRAVPGDRVEMRRGAGALPSASADGSTEGASDPHRPAWG